jgi:hypothetical protein
MIAHYLINQYTTQYECFIKLFMLKKMADLIGKKVKTKNQYAMSR